MEISKELLGEVLGSPLSYLNISCDNKCEVRHSTMFENYQEGVAYTYLYGNQETRFMSKYELAFKIEDWIESKDINVIRIKENKLYEFYINAYIDEETNELFFENSITSKTKIKGIIAVGEFILKEINEKQLQH